MLGGFLGLVFLMTVCAGQGEDTERPGVAATYRRIAEHTDCQELQNEFENADTVRKASEAGSSRAKVALSYMEAAEDRRQELSC